MSARGVSKKVQKAEKKSDNVTVAFVEALRKGRNSGLFLAKVDRVKGDGRFTVKNSDKKDVNVRISKTLFSKAAKHRNATMKTSVHVGSYVLVDGDTIRAVVGESNAAQIKSLMKVESKNNNNIFNRAGGTRKVRRH